tara:strand:+ start:11247 stop:11417 length:171 start_codon:yes stop_codon:yes gene_type:complete
MEKAGLIVKQVNHVVDKKAKNVKGIQLVDPRWHNVNRRQCGRKRLLNEYLGLRRFK